MKEKNGEHPLGDTGQLTLCGLFLVIWILDSFFWHRSTFLAEYISLVLRLIILALAIITAVYLFKSGHVVVTHDKGGIEVVSSGAFRFVRHPLYLGSILIYLGLTVSTASLFCLALLVLIFLFYNYIASYEENLLETKFGETYMAYEKKTGKWVPGISKKC